MYANKTILSMSSPVMKAMFEFHFKEKDAKEIVLPGKKLKPFLDLLKTVHPPNQFKGNNYMSTTVRHCIKTGESSIKANHLC